MEKDKETASYREIFKSSFLIGGSQIVNIIIGIIKNKVLALFLGPSGVGIMGVYVSVSSLVSSVSNMGINSSAVKQVAEADSLENKSRLNYLIKIIRKLLLISGLSIVLIIVAFSKSIAILSFGKDFKNEFVFGIAIISLLVLFDNLSTGERGILQGLRKLRELAVGQILGASMGAALGILIIYFFNYKGIAYYLLATSVSVYLISRIQVSQLKLGRDDSLMLEQTEQKAEMKSLIGLGLAFLVTVLAGSIVSYIERLLIIRSLGVEGVGIYQSAWGLVNMSFNLVLVAMATDFYPRLVAVSTDTKLINKTVNDQVEITLLAALPILLVIYVFCPFLLQIFYSSKFLSGNELTKWLAISCFFKVLCWPLGYIIIAKGKKNLFMITSIIWEIIHIPTIILCMNHWGLKGIGISYVLVYFLVTLGSTLVTFIYFKFTWSKEALKSIFISLGIIIVLICLNAGLLPKLYFYSFGIVSIVFTTIRFFYMIESKFEMNLIQKIKNRIK